MRLGLLAAALAAAACIGGPAVAQDAPPAPNDYGNPAAWLCLPGRAGDACAAADLSTTVIAADGATRVEPFHADPAAPIDCFYVYPTVSNDPGVLATMAAEPEELRVVQQQFARFASVCRPYAPLYRQFTLTALRAALIGRPLPGSAGARPTTPYDDVLAAWRYYLAHYNHGRGVVLIGHSQGSGVLTQLIAREIDGKPEQRLLVSAILMGTSLPVPAGADVGGAFHSVTLCRSPAQVGCAIAYASFREGSPPPANSRFGRPREPKPGLVAACSNPANLSGGWGDLKSYMPARALLVATPGAPAPPAWVAGKPIDTAFVALPGMLTARCVSTPEFNYLAIRVDPGPPGPRARDIYGDVVIGGAVQKDWGLHLIDANLAMGNLIDIVREEGAAWTHR